LLTSLICDLLRYAEAKMLIVGNSPLDLNANRSKSAALTASTGGTSG